MSNKAYAERLARALERTGLCQSVNATFGEGRVSVLCRVPGESEEKWIALVKNILMGGLDSAGEAYAWISHICRNYFIKESDTGERKLVWGWNVSIHSIGMPDALDVLSRIINGQPLRANGSKELTEFPLHGAPPNRGTGDKGKGAYTIGGSQDFSVTRSNK